MGCSAASLDLCQLFAYSERQADFDCEIYSDPRQTAMFLLRAALKMWKHPSARINHFLAWWSVFHAAVATVSSGPAPGSEHGPALPLGQLAPPSEPRLLASIRPEWPALLPASARTGRLVERGWTTTESLGSSSEPRRRLAGRGCAGRRRRWLRPGFVRGLGPGFCGQRPCQPAGGSHCQPAETDGGRRRLWTFVSDRRCPAASSRPDRRPRRTAAGCRTFLRRSVLCYCFSGADSVTAVSPVASFGAAGLFWLLALM